MPPPRDASRALEVATAAALAGAVGFAVTGVEFASVRQVAPAFGQSVVVWSATIGVLLLALAAGNAWGGRWAGKGSGPSVRLTLLLAAAWEALAGALLGPALLQALPLGGGLGTAVAGSILHGPPLALWATVSPRLTAAHDRDGSSGSAAGWLLAAGTLGGLAGCFAAPLWLLQELGTRATLWVCAGLPLLVGLLGPATATARRSDLPRPAARGSGPSAGVLVAAGIAGAAVMALEFLAVRLFGPWFGQSNRIWANTIGLILLALALGAWMGARLAARGAHRRGASLLLLLGGAGLPAAALWGPALAESLLPRDVDSLHLLPLAFVGSVATAGVFLGLPMLLLGAVPPLLVARLAPTLGAGRAAGRVSAAGTLGSLLGTVLTPLVLVPTLGSRRGLLLLAEVLLLAAAAAWGGERARLVRGAGVLAAALGLLGVLGMAPWTVREHPGQLVEVESAYQTVRVVRERVGVLVPEGPPSVGGWQGEAAAVFLRHDEDAETYQSIWLTDPGSQGLTGGRYYEQMALGARLAARGPEGRLRVLIVGYAGGAVHRTLRDTLPPGTTLEVLGVEIDPAVARVAREHLDLASLEGPDLTLVTGEDARTVVNGLPSARRFDLVLVDAYARTNYIPFQCATREFFGHLRDHLAPGGWVGVNVLGTGFGGAVCRAVATTLDTAVGPTFLHPNLWFPGNVILWSSADPAARPRLRMASSAERLPPLLEVSAFALERLGVRHVPATDGGVLLTDDLSPSDRLADEELGL